jgi:hypothetical protein
VWFLVRKTTSEQERAILTTLYLAGAKNTDSWHVRKGDLQRAFPLNIPMVPSPKLSFVTNGNSQTDIGLTPGSTIHFGSLEFTADHLGRLSLSPRSGTQASYS